MRQGYFWSRIDEPEEENDSTKSLGLGLRVKEGNKELQRSCYY